MKFLNLTLSIEVINYEVIPALRYLLFFIEQIFSLWAIIIYMQCLGETQKFSVKKSFINSFLSFLIIIGPILLFIGLGIYVKNLRS